MDLLGSILGNMQKPPTAGISKEKELAKKQEEKMKKLHEAEKAKLKVFRDKIQHKVDKFIQEDDETELKFEPMEKNLRAIVHDVVEIAQLPAFSFGIDDVDRHVVVYKLDTVPDDDELNALRKGEVFDPEKLKQQRLQEEEDERDRFRKQPKIVPKSSYSEKYEHLIGKDAGVSTAQITTANSQFGLVPSSNKRDQRSIEQTLADIKKKKLKNESGSCSETAVKDEDDE